MKRFVVMVDAGYLLRQSIEIVSARASTTRSHLEIVDPAGLISLLVDKSRAALNIGARELLRVYWYDGVMTVGLTRQQKVIIDVDDVHFRAGTINSAGQQKGVDSLIVTDLIELAANHAISDAALITGDSDLAVGIELTQKKGVRIAVIGVEDLEVGVSHRQSFEIISRADRVARIGLSDLASRLRYVAPELPQGMADDTSERAEFAFYAVQEHAAIELSSADQARIEQAVKAFIAEQPSLDGAVDVATKRIDARIDRALIHYLFAELAHGALSTPEKNYARHVFRSVLAD